VGIFDALVAAADQMGFLPRGVDVDDVFHYVLHRDLEHQRG